MRKHHENEIDRAERIAYIREISRRLHDMDIDTLRRVDWYIDRIDRR